MISDAELDVFATRTAEALLNERCAAGHWEGELSSSELSTATAICALILNGEDDSALIATGFRWLRENQNDDGGWGDTVRSFSNVSTTTLCRAVFCLAANDTTDAGCIERAEAWLQNYVGSDDKAALCETIYARYGKDRTFAVPILTMCALTGYLGKDAWQRIVPLPFEAAAIPHGCYRFVNMQVVSYALPALIAIGLVNFVKRPPKPLARLVRAKARPRVLRKLESIQPASGGFLEATPLTSFVAMSLVGAGETESPVLARCLAFLRREARADGSWPIDTNLATWVTTLSVNALAAGGQTYLEDEARTSILDWLLKQQYAEVHPYTNSPPGAWAWTDLTGGVPDGDDTPGAPLALRHLEVSDATRRSASRGVSWLIQLQNGNGGFPTFCRGWGRLPFDQSCSDLTIHVLRSFAVWKEDLSPRKASFVARSERFALQYLDRVQRPDGSWLPRWFGNQHVDGDENPIYGTAKVVVGLADLGLDDEDALKRGAGFLLRAQNDDGGWGGGDGTPSSIEETALVVEALAAISAPARSRPTR